MEKEGDDNKGGSINLIELLNNKQKNVPSSQKVDQDSSLENNYSQDSDDDDDDDTTQQYVQNDHGKGKKERRSDKNSSQPKQDQKKNSSLSSSSSQKNNSTNKQKKVTRQQQQQHLGSQSSQENNTAMNLLTQTDRSSYTPNQRLREAEEEEGDVEEQKNQQNRQPPSSIDPFSFSVFDSHDDEEDSNAYQIPRTSNYHNSPFGQNQNNTNNNVAAPNLERNIDLQENVQSSSLARRSPIPPLQSLFRDILPSDLLRNAIMNPSNSVQQNQYQEYLNNPQLDRLRNERQRRQRQRFRNNPQLQRRMRNVCPEGFQILSTEAAQNQIRYLYCTALSLVLIFFVLIYSMQNQNKVIIFLLLTILITSLFYILYKIKRINQSRVDQIHENNFYSYRFSNPVGGQNYEEEQQDNNLLERISNLESNLPAQRRQVRYFSNMMLFNSIFSILSQIQQNNRGEVGYNEQQLEQIGGTHKYADLKILLKIQKEDNPNINKQKSGEKENENKQNEEEEEEEDDNSCIVCLEKYGLENDVRILKCQHYFHQHCLDEWMKKKKECPVCRRCPLEIEPTAEQIAQPNLSAFPSLIPMTFLNQSRALRIPSIEGQENQRDRSRNRRQNMNVVFLYQ